MSLLNKVRIVSLDFEGIERKERKKVIESVKLPRGAPEGLFYFKEAVSNDLTEELEKWFESDYFESRKFPVSNTQGISSANAREVLHFGYRYDYKTRHAKSQAIEKMPDIIKQLRSIIPEVWREAPDDILRKLNQCIINIYLPGQGIGAHVDKIEFGDTIVCFTFLSGREMSFIKEDGTEFVVYTYPSSMYVMTKDARYTWKHEMKKRKKDGNITRGTVISVTFREVCI